MKALKRIEALRQQEERRQEENHQEEVMKQEKMAKVLVILESLFEREEATIKQILDCLYDVGSFNLLDRRVSHRFLNRLSKSIVHLPKPLLIMYLSGWVKKKSPRLITAWLKGRVAFMNVPK